MVNGKMPGRTTFKPHSTQRNPMKSIVASTALVLLSQTALAQQNATEFPGRYVRQEFEAWHELVVLEDHSFCIYNQNGNGELLMAGHWQQDGDQATLQEVRLPPRAFKTTTRADKNSIGKRTVVLLGSSLAEARGQVFLFGTSADGKVPADMRPILAADHNGFEQYYTLPLSNNREDSIFFGRRIGSIDPATQMANYEITELRFSTPEKNVLRVWFDKDVNRPLFKNEIFFRDGRMVIGRKNSLVLGKREPLTDEGVAGVKSHCVDPILKPAQEKKGAPDVEVVRIFEMKLKNPEARPPYFVKDPDAPSGRPVING